MKLLAGYATWFIVCILAVACLYLCMQHSWLLVPALILVILAIVGLIDSLQSKHSLRRNYPLIAWVRWLFEALRPYLYQYIVESSFSGRPYTREERSLIYARAKQEEDFHPFGSGLDVYSSEYEFISQSVSPAPEVKPETLRVMVGSSQCQNPYSASVLNISAMSFGALSANAIRALNLGAKNGNFYHDTGEGSISKYHEEFGGDLVWELGTGYFGARSRDGKFDPVQFKDKAANPQVKMVEIKLSQGAKPGHGGVLPGAKVSAEIAATRGVSIGQDCVSPAYHQTFNSPLELIHWAASLRELSGGKPVGIKLCVGRPIEVMALMKAMLASGIYLDFIVVDGAEGGTGAAPVEFSNHLGMPLRDGLIIMRNALVGSGLKNEVKLAASGKMSSAFSIAANAALGADWTNAARAFMFSLGCIMAKRCNTDTCPSGVATQNQFRQRGLVVQDKAKRVQNFHARTLEALAQLLAAAGVTSCNGLSPEHLYYRENPITVESMASVHHFLQGNELIEGCDNLDYAKWWQQADPHRFG